MSTLFKGSEGSHWYRKDGTAQHDADLRVARKEMLFPSPTSVDKDQFVNAFLDKWKKEQILIACVENPQWPDEELEDYAKRIEELANTKSRVASEFGTKVHDACENYPDGEPEESIAQFVMHFGDWFNRDIQSVVARETVMLDHEIGVAGKTDMVSMMRNAEHGRAVVDYKTQGIKYDKKTGKKNKPIFYPSWARQLAFYASCDSKNSGMWPNMPTCISVVIDSTEPGPVHVKVWDRQEILDAYHDFVIGVNCWCRKRNYWPGSLGQWNVSPTCAMPQS
jgi:hypothetical protein